MFSDKLKNKTSSVHQGLEKKLILHIKKISSVGDYVELLRLMYGFYAPVQQSLAAFARNSGDAAMQNQLRGRHADNILLDIGALTGNAETPALAGSLPGVSSWPEALGVLYVTEGSTLGGVIIAGMISKKLNIDTGKGFSFFNAYGSDTQANWEAFKSQLNAPLSETEKLSVEQAAMDTFESFSNWVTEYESAAHQ